MYFNNKVRERTTTSSRRMYILSRFARKYSEGMEFERIMLKKKYEGQVVEIMNELFKHGNPNLLNKDDIEWELIKRGELGMYSIELPGDDERQNEDSKMYNVDTFYGQCLADNFRSLVPTPVLGYNQFRSSQGMKIRGNKPLYLKSMGYRKVGERWFSDQENGPGFLFEDGEKTSWRFVYCRVCKKNKTRAPILVEYDKGYVCDSCCNKFVPEKKDFVVGKTNKEEEGATKKKKKNHCLVKKFESMILGRSCTKK
jgi:hypothetical protein